MKKILIKGANETIYEHTCKNGLKVYIWPYDLTEEISLSLNVKYGSIHTEFTIDNKKYKVPNGMAHFLEHIKFNENKDITAHEYFNKIGSYTNAYTTYDHTCYEVICNDKIKENLTHLLYFVFNPYFTKNIIQKEKPIIIEESKTALDNPYNVGYFHLMNNIYFENKKRFLVTGEEKDIKDISLSDVLNVFNNFYVPSNMFLIITGKVNPYEIEKILDEYYEKDTTDIIKVELIDNKEPNKVKKEYEEIKVNVTKEKLLYACKIPKSYFKGYDDLDLRVLLNILLSINFDTTSQFNDYIINNGLVDDFYKMVDINDDNIIIIFESSTTYPKEIIKLLDDKMKNLAFPEEDFDRKRKVLIASSILGYEDATDVNNDIRADIIKYNHIIDNIKEYYESLKAKDGEKMINNIRDYKTSVVILKPLKKD